MSYPTFDAQDQEILTYRTQCFWHYERTLHPRVGDYVDFADGVTRRVSHVWDWADGLSYQTSDGGSFYLGEGYMSFSGGLHPAIPRATLTRVDEVRPGQAWFFHHDHHTAYNAVYVSVPCAVWTCTLTSKERAA